MIAFKVMVYKELKSQKKIFWRVFTDHILAYFMQLMKNKIHLSLIRTNVRNTLPQILVIS